MQVDDQEQNLTFSKSAAWLGLVAYLVLILLITTIFFLG